MSMNLYIPSREYTNLFSGSGARPADWGFEKYNFSSFVYIVFNLICFIYDTYLIWSIYIIKQDIHINVAYSRPNGWTEWAEFFVDTVTGNPESKETVGINSVQSSHPLWVTLFIVLFYKQSLFFLENIFFQHF